MREITSFAAIVVEDSRISLWLQNLVLWFLRGLIVLRCGELVMVLAGKLQHVAAWVLRKFVRFMYGFDKRNYENALDGFCD